MEDKRLLTVKIDVALLDRLQMVVKIKGTTMEELISSIMRDEIIKSKHLIYDYMMDFNKETDDDLPF